MRTVVGEFRHLHHVRVSNVYLLDGGPGDRWLVDCGHWSERATLLWELRRAGVRRTSTESKSNRAAVSPIPSSGFRVTRRNP